MNIEPQPCDPCREAALATIEELMRTVGAARVMATWRSGEGEHNGVPFAWAIGGLLSCDGVVLSTTRTKIAVVLETTPRTGRIFAIQPLFDEIERGRVAVPGPAQVGLFEGLL